MGGKLVSFDFALGEDDAYVIAEVPDVVDVAAVSVAVAAAGGARVTTVQLLTPAEMDEAAKEERSLPRARRLGQRRCCGASDGRAAPQQGRQERVTGRRGRSRRRCC
jgi:GYD domain